MNDNGYPQPSNSSHISGSIRWKGFFATSRWHELIDQIKKTTIESVMDSATFFLRCEIVDYTTCPYEGGLLSNAWFVFLVALVTVLVYRQLITFASSTIVLLWLIAFPALVVNVTYQVSPFCWPAIPGCLVDNLVDDLLTFFKPPTGVSPPSSYLYNMVDQSLQGGTCWQSPYYFSSVFANIAFSLAASDGLKIWELVDDTPFQGLFPIYNASTYDGSDPQKAENFATCNFLTSSLHLAILLILARADRDWETALERRIINQFPYLQPV